MTNEAISLRRVTSEDLPTLCQLSRQTFSEAFETANDPEPFQAYLDKAFSEEQLHEELKHPLSQFFFAEVNGIPVGYLKLVEDKHPKGGQSGKVLEIQRIYVKRDRLGMGVGKTLMEKALELGLAKQVEYVWLGVWEFNPKAIAFYDKWGFKPFGSQEFKMGAEIQNDILMKKDLFSVSQRSNSLR